MIRVRPRRRLLVLSDRKNNNEKSNKFTDNGSNIHNQSTIANNSINNDDYANSSSFPLSSAQLPNAPGQDAPGLSTNAEAGRAVAMAPSLVWSSILQYVTTNYNALSYSFHTL